jgi:hypothetical protein
MESRRGWKDRHTKVDLETLKEEERKKSKRDVLAVSKLFQYGKTTVPKPVRLSLDVKDGDKMIWSIDETGKITVSKVSE